MALLSLSSSAVALGQSRSPPLALGCGSCKGKASTNVATAARVRGCLKKVPGRRRRALVVAATDTEEGRTEEAAFSPDPGCTIVQLKLSRPLGIVFEAGKEGGVIVSEVPKEGKAFKPGLVAPGDELIATSAVVYQGTMNYGGVEVPHDMQVVRIPTRRESFDAIMAAIESHPASIKVTLEFQKCGPLDVEIAQGIK